MMARFLSSISGIRGSLLGAEGRGPHVEAREPWLNALVHEVCGLTEGEMAIVEGTLDGE